MPRLDHTNLHLHRRGTGPSLVLLHGLGTAHDAWNGLAPLADRYTLLSYDLPGHGESPAPGSGFTIDDLSDQLAALLVREGIGRTHLAGSSIGGMIAQQFAAAWPGRVDRLVLIDTSPGMSDGRKDELSTMAGRGPAHAAMAEADLMDLAEEIYAPTLILCAEGADLAMRDGADFLARSIPGGQLAFVPGAAVDAVAEQPAWVAAVLRDFLGRA